MLFLIIIMYNFFLEAKDRDDIKMKILFSLLLFFLGTKHRARVSPWMLLSFTMLLLEVLNPRFHFGLQLKLEFWKHLVHLYIYKKIKLGYIDTY